ncbi:hypothetical protein BH11BAC2_BH11BAC2_05700 [soil metagenome]
MKSISTCLVLCLFSICTFAQSSFISTYNSTATEDFIDIAPISGGGYYAIGTTISPGSGTADILLMKMDANGQQLWSKVYDSGDDDFAAAIKILPGGNLAILGTYYPSLLGFQDMILMSIDSSGNFISMNSYGGPDEEVARAMQLLNNGNLLITGSTASFGTLTQSAIAMEINSSGQTVWSNTYGHLPINCFNSALELSNGTLLFTGYTMDNGNYEGYIVNTTSGGVYNWEKTFEGPGHDEFTSCMEDPGLQAIIAAGITSDSTAGQTDLFIAGFDENGTTYSTGIIGTTDFDWCTSIHPSTIAGDIILTGYSTVSDSNGINNAPFALSIDPLTPQINWSVYYSDGISEARSQKSIINNGQLIMAGFRQETLQFESSSLLISMPLQPGILCLENNLGMNIGLSTLTEGLPITANAAAAVNVASVSTVITNVGVLQDSVFCTTTSLQEQLAVSKLEIFPNPVSHELHLRSPLTSGIYTITDMQGREYQRSFITYDQQIDVATLPAGLYLLHLESSNSRFTVKFVKEVD